MLQYLQYVGLAEQNLFVRLMTVGKGLEISV